MKKNVYIAPEMEEIKIGLFSSVLLEISGNDNDNDQVGGGDYDPSQPLD